ncbi:hypothetical protein ACNKHN_25040 [Shigella flexneri]
MKNVTCYVSWAKTGGIRGIGPGKKILRCGHFLSASRAH